ncbi:MAG: zinc-binding dehydrogenase [Umezawaea sp.]
MRIIRVAEFGGPEVLVPQEAQAPIAGPGEAVVDVAVAPVLFLDAQMRSGTGAEYFPLRPPYVPGVGVAGRVASVGDGVDQAWVGRRVVADVAGGYVEQALVGVDGLVEVPDDLGLVEAAALLHDGRTAMGLVDDAAIQPGDRVLVTAAAGGLGSLLVQVARAAGAHVVGAARGRRKLDAVRALGADAVVDYTEPGWADDLVADVVFDGVGGQIGLAAFSATAPGGRFSAHGTPGGGFAPVDSADAQRRGVRLSGIERVQFPPEQAKRLVGRALAEAAAGRIRPVVGQTFPLEEAADAHAAIEARDVVGKVLLLT